MNTNFSTKVRFTAILTFLFSFFIVSCEKESTNSFDEFCKKNNIILNKNFNVDKKLINENELNKIENRIKEVDELFLEKGKQYEMKSEVEKNTLKIAPIKNMLPNVIVSFHVETTGFSSINFSTVFNQNSQSFSAPNVSVGGLNSGFLSTSVKEWTSTIDDDGKPVVGFIIIKRVGIDLLGVNIGFNIEENQYIIKKVTATSFILQRLL